MAASQNEIHMCKVIYTKFCLKNTIILFSPVDRSTGEDGNDVACATHTMSRWLSLHWSYQLFSSYIANNYINKTYWLNVSFISYRG